MTGITRLPEVVDRLVLELTDELVPDLLDEVLDGPTLGVAMLASLVLGIAADQDETGYDVELIEQQSLGRTRFEERWTVGVLLSITDEDGVATMSQLRSRAGQVLEAIERRLRDEAPVVDGVWQKVALGDRMQWLPIVDGRAPTISVFFAVTGRSLL